MNFDERTSEALANAFTVLTHRDIDKFLSECYIEIKHGNNKKEKLFYSFRNEKEKSNSSEKVLSFIQKVLNPLNYIDDDKRNSYDSILETINKILIMHGLRISEEGKITFTEKTNNLKEIDKKINGLKNKLKQRGIHSEVLRYCKEDYLRKDYYDAVFEASKSLADRVRNITGLNDDGSKLFQTVFNKNNPCIVLNTLETESEKNEFNGLRELLECISHLVRNPAAHTPKINWKTNEDEALDVLSVVSFAHKYLDKCYPMPNKLDTK